MTVFVAVSARIRPGTNTEFERAFAEVSAVVRGTDGHLSDRLLRDGTDPDRYVLLGTWASEAKFLSWEDAPVHREATTPMRQFWAGPVERTIYQVAVDGGTP